MRLFELSEVEITRVDCTVLDCLYGAVEITTQFRLARNAFDETRQEMVDETR